MASKYSGAFMVRKEETWHEFATLILVGHLHAEQLKTVSHCYYFPCLNQGRFSNAANGIL